MTWLTKSPTCAIHNATGFILRKVVKGYECRTELGRIIGNKLMTRPEANRAINRGLPEDQSTATWLEAFDEWHEDEITIADMRG